MSATYELRRMLDERGVVHRWDNGTATWYVDGVMYNAWGYDSERLTMSVCHLTPEQAVEATLGRGTCHVVISDNLAESEGTGDAWADCSECGHLLFVLTDPNSEPPNYCPGCGRKVVE